MHLPSVLFAFVAGILSILAPCVLPLVPIVLATAVSEHKLGPVALAAGVAVSFAAIGIFVATIGFAAGIGSMLARVCLVNNLGIVLMDELVQPQVGPAQPPRSRHTQSLRSAHMRAHGNRSIVCWAPCFLNQKLPAAD